MGIICLKLIRSPGAKKLFFFFVVLQLSIISGLRAYSVGWDTENYVLFYKEAASLSISQIIKGSFDIEKGYIIFEYLVAKISKNPSTFFLILSGIYMLMIGKLIYKFSADPIYSFILFISLGYFAFSMTALRQTLAIAVVLMSFKFLVERRFFPFLFYVLLASTFHISALVFLPAYWIARIQYTKLYGVLSFLAIPLAFLLKGKIFTLITMATGFKYEPMQTSGPIALFFLLLLVYIAAVIQIRPLLARGGRNLYFFNFLLVGILLTTIAFIHPAALRISYFYSIFAIVLIPEIIKSFYDNKIRYLIYAFSLVMLIGMYVSNLTPDSPFVPYRFFFN